MDVQGLMKRARSVSGGKAEIEVDNALPRFKWVVIESRLLDGEEVILVMEKRYLKEAREEHLGKAIYFPPEIRELYKNKEAKDFIKLVHEAKKEFKGWVIPKDSPIAKELNSKGDNRG